MHTLYIGGLPPHASAQTLQGLFDDISGLRSVRVVTGEGGHCRGFGYVTFDNREAMFAARRKDGISLGDCTLRVAPAR